MSSLVAVLGLAGAAVLSLALTPLVIRLGHRWQMLDQPGGRRVHTQAVPRLGGVAVFFSASIAGIAILVGQPFEPGQLRTVVGLFIAADLMFLMGLVDDLRGLRPRTKVAVQLVAATIAVACGLRPEAIIVGPNVEIALGSLAVPLTIVWVLAVTNAFNLIDGLNGLASGIAIVACIGGAIMAAATGHVVALVVLAALTGALLGFLPFNYPRARIFLGDSGSMSVGFLLAWLLVYASMRPGTRAVYAPLPVAAMLLPFLDTALAIARRWLRNTSLSGADSRHIHHQLLAMGLSVSRATAALWAFAAILVALGVGVVLATPQVSLAIALIGGVFLLACLVYGATLLSYHELVVAASVLWTGFGRARRLVTQQIHAVDVADAIRKAESIARVDAILAAEAARFGFRGMEITYHQHGHGAALDPAHLRTPARSWRLEYRLHPDGAAASTGYSIGIWCDTGSSMQVYGAERVARTLAPAVTDRLEHALRVEATRRWSGAVVVNGSRLLPRMQPRKSGARAMSLS